ncbi:GNAT family N-acetyltransferase [Candidatus Woesearchaeota archaeon]|nr:GNAT family N-acetyltransferase [Candidatus Woesearchaeota archaeon]
MRKKALIAFIIRQYETKDLEEVIRVYKSAFAEPPWNEFLKCSFCSVEYGKKEAIGETCKKCKRKTVLIEYWSNAEIIKDLEYAIAQPEPIVLVAELKNLAGFTWGYKIPPEKFPFLKTLVPENAVYMDEVAVRSEMRQKGIGKKLCIAFLETAKKPVVLRTDERNTASMALFARTGFVPVLTQGKPVKDPEYPNRIYLWRQT